LKCAYIAYVSLSILSKTTKKYLLSSKKELFDSSILAFQVKKVNKNHKNRQIPQKQAKYEKKTARYG